MPNVFLNPVGPVQDLASELAKFAASKLSEGIVCGMRVRRDSNGNCTLPLACTMTIKPLEMKREGIMSQEIMVLLPFEAQSGGAFPSMIRGSAAPSRLRGHDRINFWVNQADIPSQQNEDGEGNYDDEYFDEGADGGDFSADFIE